MTAMKVIRLPEGGRAALAFPHESADVGPAQRAAMTQASRGNILKNWLAFPQWFRRDPGFQCLMDHYYPVDDETMQLQRRRQDEMVVDTIKSLFGSGALKPGHAAIPTDDEVINAIRALGAHRACVDIAVPFGIPGSTISTTSASRTVAALIGRVGQAVRLWGFDIGFDGTTSTSGPGIVEIQKNTLTTNTGSSTSVTPLLIDFGRPESVQSSGYRGFTNEPTTLTTVETFFIPNYMGSGIVFTPLTKPFILSAGGTPNGGTIRVTQQSGITGNATGTLKGEE